ncbi:uncharacterized protein LOC135378355 [Ornithodoros turicata]|uniref:uncharacterized protein LOC135378355 n=1 Tax=Ornithodoros turicata TaxID=34597 RepID=UPI003138E20C
MERLKSKRGTRRAQTTRIPNEASTVLKDGTASAEALNALLQRLTTSNAELVVLNTAIEPLVTDEDYERYGVKSVAGLPITEASYDDATEILKERFESHTWIAFTRSSRQFLRSNANRNTIIFPAIGNRNRLLPLGSSPDHHQHCKPNRCRRHRSGVHVNDSYDELQAVLKFLHVEVESREKSEVAERNLKKQIQPVSKTATLGRANPSAAVLHNASTNPAPCFFCSNTEHSTEECVRSVQLSDKKAKLAKDKRCFRCTKKGHSARDCRGRMRCRNCGGRHVTSMCDPSWKPDKKERAITDAKDVTNVLVPGGACRNGTVVLQTFRCWAVGRGKCIYVRGVVDGGSQQTFISKQLADHLKLKVIDTVTLTLNTFGDTSASSERKQCNVVELSLHSQFSPSEYLLKAVIVPVICRDIIATPLNIDLVTRIQESGGVIADDLMFQNATNLSGINLLLGADQLWNFVTGRIERCYNNENFVGIETTLGWTFQGPTNSQDVDCVTSSLMTCVQRTDAACDCENSRSLRQMWQLDGIGIKDETTIQDDDRVFQQVFSTVSKENGRYTVALPWKTSASDLPDNRDIAERRLRSLVKRLHKEKKLEEYDRAIQKYMSDGIAEQVRGKKTSDRLYYMPHRAVVREGSTSTRVRVVFDAPSHAAGCCSLNDCLETGPKINCDLLSTLLRFRLNNVALVADIEKAFLQVAVRGEDRDALRFLWFEQPPTSSDCLPPICEWRMTRVPFGTSASSFLLGATMLHHLRNVSGPEQEVAQMMADSFYVDDLLPAPMQQKRQNAS